jgi:hypothetical protein
MVPQTQRGGLPNTIPARRPNELRGQFETAWTRSGLHARPRRPGRNRRSLWYVLWLNGMEIHSVTEASGESREVL